MSILRRSDAEIENAYQSYADLMYRVAKAQLSSEADAQDAVQEAFVRYMTRAPFFFGSEHEKAWLLRVTVNLCHDFARKKAKQNTVSLDEVAEISVEDDGAYRELLEELQTLPEHYREVVILHGLEGFGLQECARILNISLSAAKMRWQRAREMLRQSLQEE